MNTPVLTLPRTALKAFGCCMLAILTPLLAGASAQAASASATAGSAKPAGIPVPATVATAIADSGTATGAHQSAETYSLAPSLFWEPVAGATDYRVEIATTPDFSGEVHRDRTPITRYVKAGGMEPGAYYWRVAAQTAAGVGEWSQPRSLRVLTPERVFQIPANADISVIARIVAQAAAQTPARVVFAKDVTYRLRPDRDLINLRNVKDLDIDGNGATLVITNPVAGFATLTDCERVTIRNFTIEHDPIPFTVARVTSVDAASGRVGVTMDPQMPALDAEHIQKHWTWGVVLDGQTPGRIKTGSPLVVSMRKDGLERTGQGTFSMQLDTVGNARHFAPGDKWVQFARNNGGRGLLLATRCKELALIGITNYTISGGHYMLLECSDSKVLDCHALIKGERWMGGNADGIHARSNAIGVWVEGSTFEGLGDDGIALYSKGIQILGKPSDNELLLDDEFFNLVPGLEFLVFDPAAGQPVAEALIVKTVERRPAGNNLPSHWAVSFEPAIEGALFLEGTKAWQNAQVFDRSNQHQEFMIRRNTFKQIRRYGTIVRAINGALEDNTFIQTSDCAIVFMNEPRMWRNGLHSRDIIIQRNRIIDCNFSSSAVNRGVIHVQLRGLGDPFSVAWQTASTQWRGHANFVIRDNEISQWYQSGIYVESAQNVQISGNRISELLSGPAHWPAAVPIYVDNVDGAVIRDNTVTGLPRGMRSIEVINSENVITEGNTPR